MIKFNNFRIIPSSESALLNTRASFEAELDALIAADPSTVSIDNAPPLYFGFSHGYYLAFHGYNNVAIKSKLFRVYSRMCPALLQGYFMDKSSELYEQDEENALIRASASAKYVVPNTEREAVRSEPAALTLPEGGEHTNELLTGDDFYNSHERERGDEVTIKNDTIESYGEDGSGANNGEAQEMESEERELYLNTEEHRQHERMKHPMEALVDLAHALNQQWPQRSPAMLDSSSSSSSSISSSSVRSELQPSVSEVENPHEQDGTPPTRIDPGPGNPVAVLTLESTTPALVVSTAETETEDCLSVGGGNGTTDHSPPLSTTEQTDGSSDHFEEGNKITNEEDILRIKEEDEKEKDEIEQQKQQQQQLQEEKETKEHRMESIDKAPQAIVADPSTATATAQKLQQQQQEDFLAQDQRVKELRAMLPHLADARTGKALTRIGESNEIQ